MNDNARDENKRVFPPPDRPVECSCLHCGRIYMSDMMIEVEIDGEYHYACPAPGCTAMGWNFDIFSTSEDDNDEDGGWVYVDDEDEEYDDEEFELENDSVLGSNEGAVPFDPPQPWSPEADAEVQDEEVFEDDSDEDALRGTVFTREEYEQLKSAGEYDRKIAEIREHWRGSRQPDHDRRDHPKNDDDIPF